jgi:excisionase family DNA binding protein
MHGQKLLTVEQVAEFCSVDRKTVRRWIRKRELAAFRLGQQLRISEADLKAFLKRRWIRAVK